MAPRKTKPKKSQEVSLKIKFNQEVQSLGQGKLFSWFLLKIGIWRYPKCLKEINGPESDKNIFEQAEVAHIGPIYPVFGEQSVKRGGKVTKRLVLKEKLIWVRWQSDNLKEEWTAEPLKHFTGVAKAKALKCMEKKECWPWSDRDRIDTLKSLGQYFF